MPLLADEDVKYLKEQFAALERDVTITVVTRERSILLPGEEPAGDTSREVKMIAEELAATSPKLKLVAIDAARDEERAREVAGERLPAIVFSSETSRGQLRYVGLPAGYEMSSVVATIGDLGGAAPVPEDVRARLAKLSKDVHIQVFVTPS